MYKNFSASILVVLIVNIVFVSLSAYRLVPAKIFARKLQSKDVGFRSSFILKNDLLGEEIKELREGIDAFQRETFKALYDGKQVKWDPSRSNSTANGSSPTIESIESTNSNPAPDSPSSEVLPLPAENEIQPIVSTPSAVVETVQPSLPVEPKVEPKVEVPKAKVVAPKVEAPKVEAPKVEAPKVEVPKAPVVPIEATVTFSKEKPSVAPEGLILKDIPIDTSVKETSVGPSTEDILKAQQAVAKSFLALAQPTETTVEPSVPAAATVKVAPPATVKPPVVAKEEAPKPVKSVPAPAPVPAVAPKESVLEGLFGFLKSDPSLQAAAEARAKARPTGPPAVARAFIEPPKPAAPPAVTAKEVKAVTAEKLPPKPAVVTIAEARKEATKASEVVSPAVATKKVAPASSTASEPQKGGFFGLFQSPPSVVPAVSAPPKTAAVTTTEARKEVSKVKEPISQPLATKSTVAATSEPPKGGLFGLFQAPPAPVAKPVPSPPTPAVPKAAPPAPVKAAVAKVTPSTPPAPAAVPPAAASGGFFSFLNPTPAAPAVPSTKTTSVVPAAPKATVPAAPKATVPAAPKTAVAKPATVAPAKSTPPTSVPPTGGLFSFLSSTPSSPSSSASEPAKKAAVTAAPAKTAAPVPKAVSTTAPATSTFSLFSFGSPSVPATKKEENVGAAVATKPAIAKPAPVTASKPAASTSSATAKPAVATKPVATAPVTTKISPPAPAVSGGFFGFLNSNPPEKKTVPPPAAPVVKPAAVTPAKVTTTVASKTAPSVPAKPLTDGFFGLGSKPKVAEKKEEKAAAPSTPAPTVKVSAAVKAAPVASKPAAAKAPAAAAAAPQSSGGFFSFLSTSSASKPAPPTTTAPPATAAKTTTAAVPASKAKAAPVPVKEAPKVAAAPPASGGFSFGFPKPAPSVPAPVKADPVKPATAMNSRFQTTVSQVLKKDAVKIGLFQTATDNYRSGNTDATAFLASIEKLFGGSPNPTLLDSIVPPLIAELPEKKLAEQLKVAYDKKVAAAKAAAAKEPLPIKAPAKVPIVQKALVESQLKALAAGSVQADGFFTVLEKELGRTKLKEVSAELLAVLPKDKADKLRAVFQTKGL